MAKKSKKYDFGGYATKVGLKCSDGRTIMHNAFQEADGKVVPLMYQHLHNDPKNVLGHALLENRADGVYAYCSLNDTDAGKTARELVEHGDISALSIYANSLVEKSKNVIHGVIREVSLVIAGANPEAYIDNLVVEHGDGSTSETPDEAVICMGALDGDADGAALDLDGDSFAHSDSEPPAKKAPPTKAKGDEGEGDGDDDDDETVGDVFESLNHKQKTAVYAVLASALEAADGGDSKPPKAAPNGKAVKHSDEGDNTMKKHLFEGAAGADDKGALQHDTLTREGLREIINDARQSQSTLKNAFLAHGFTDIKDALSVYEHRDDVLAHSASYGVENIEYLFPDARNTTTAPQFIKRDTEWVAKVFGGAKHVPFSRIKTVLADITADEARARGYVKGNQKIDEVITLIKRTTDPQTVYKHQKLDRDDVVDITDFDVIIWLRAEMRMMLEEEIARAQLVGDGRPSSSNDKIKEDKIRPIATDNEVYTIEVQIDAIATTSDVIDKVVLGRKEYKGTGTPSFFTTADIAGDMLLLKDKNGRRMYNTEGDLAAALRAKEIVEVPVMENKVITITEATASTDGLQKRLIGISVNMNDYSLGADKGGNVAMFDDFDIDFNQYKYLIETRCSGALTMPKSAIAFWKLETIPKTGA